MEKLAYLYENDYDKFIDYSHKDLLKRVDRIQDIKKRTDILLLEVRAGMEKSNAINTSPIKKLGNGGVDDLEK